jgi:hypothetical protein
VGLQILIRESGDVTILDLQGRSTIDGGESELLDSRLRQLLANSVRKLLLNLVNLTQVDSSGVGAIVACEVVYGEEQTVATRFRGKSMIICDLCGEARCGSRLSQFALRPVNFFRDFAMSVRLPFAITASIPTADDKLVPKSSI